MKKISTVQILSNEIFKEQKLTIGLDLEIAGRATALGMEPAKSFWKETADHAGSDEADVWQDTANS